MASRLLTLSKIVEKRMWGFENPLRQFPHLGHEIITKLEAKRLTVEKLREMEPTEIGEHGSNNVYESYQYLYTRHENIG